MTIPALPRQDALNRLEIEEIISRNIAKKDKPAGLIRKTET